MLAMKMSEGGRVVIPAQIRRQLNLHEGDQVVFEIFKNGHSDDIRLTTRRAQLKRAQELVRAHVPQGVSLVDALIQERRQEEKNG